MEKLKQPLDHAAEKLKKNAMMRLGKKKVRNTGIILVFFLLMFFPLNLIFAQQGDEKPLWELGLVNIAGYGADYPGADESSFNDILLPYFVYRGEVFRAGEKGIARGRIFHDDRVEFDLSLDGSFDADSDGNSARKNMPDLDYLFEIGPRLQVLLSHNVLNGKLELELPIRAVFSTDFSSLSHEGFVITPLVAWQHDNLMDTGARVKVGVGPIFGSEGLMDYFYEVAPGYATAERPAFDAKSGYLGSEMRISLLKKIKDHVTMFSVIQFSYLGGAVNDDSPLFRRDFNAIVRVGIMWMPFKSEKTVRE